MDTLTELAIKYKADKWGKHHYTPLYYDLFKDKTKSVKKVLEIGVAEGASLFMWRDFFSNATIYGADNDTGRVEKLDGLDRIDVRYFDQSNQHDMIDIYDELGDDFDLIVDDGSHKSEDQITACCSLADLTKVYVIEDVSDPDLIKKLKHNFIKKDRKLNYTLQEFKVSNRYDDCLIIMKPKNG